MTEEYIEQQVGFYSLDLSDKEIINMYKEENIDQAAVSSRFFVDREEDRAVLYILWSKN